MQVLTPRLYTWACSIDQTIARRPQAPGNHAGDSLVTGQARATVAIRTFDPTGTLRCSHPWLPTRLKNAARRARLAPPSIQACGIGTCPSLGDRGNPVAAGTVLGRERRQRRARPAATRRELRVSDCEPRAEPGSARAVAAPSRGVSPRPRPDGARAPRPRSPRAALARGAAARRWQRRGGACADGRRGAPARSGATCRRPPPSSPC